MTRREHGFTLISRFVVLLVLAIGAGLVRMQFGVGRASDVLQATAYQVASRCRAARLAAIRRGTPAMVLIDLANRTVRSDGGRAPVGRRPNVALPSRASRDEQT